VSTNHEWTYYRLDRILTDDPPIFFRSWRGFVDRLDRQAMTWVSLDSDPVSRYLKNGEVGLDEITRARIETTPVPAPEAVASPRSDEGTPTGIWDMGEAVVGQVGGRMNDTDTVFSLNVPETVSSGNIHSRADRLLSNRMRAIAIARGLMCLESKREIGSARIGLRHALLAYSGDLRTFRLAPVTTK